MDRDSRGRLVPGHRDLYTPEMRAKDRARKEKQRVEIARRYREAISETLGPEEIPALLRDMVDFARFYKSTKGMEAVLRLVMDYGIGKPSRESELKTSDGSAEDWANAFADAETEVSVEEDGEWQEQRSPSLAGLAAHLQRRQVEQALGEEDRASLPPLQ